MRNESKKINLILEESDHAKEFDPTIGHLLHQAEFDKVINLIEKSVPSNGEEANRDNLHNTITILGTRGSGKTSFLLSIKRAVTEWENSSNENTEKRKPLDIQVLNIIDPTLIEEKGHVFLNVISAISELVEEKLDLTECNPTNNESHFTRKEWRENLMKLSAGLPSIDGIGESNSDGWQDPEFVMDNGLKAVSSSRNLTKNFNSLLKISLNILGKRAFLVMFDDIDVDASKGWAVLETIRKYFTGARLITLLSGDLKLYSTAIRQRKWKNFGDEILKYEGSDYDKSRGTNEKLASFNSVVTELTGQYMLKIMQPKYRIHLTTLLEKKNISKEFLVMVHTKISESVDVIEIETLYKNIFGKYGIVNNTQEEIYRTFMLSQPLRSQIQFLIAMQSPSLVGGKTIFNDKITDVFLADLHEKNIDVNLANNAAKYLSAIIVKLLLREKRLTDLYQLQPATTDGSFNACLFSLNILLSNYIKNGNLFLIFDYFIRIGFLRNLMWIIPYKNADNIITPSIEDVCDKSGIYNDNVMRDVTGHIEGYVYGCLELSGEVKPITHSFIRLLGLKGPARRPLNDRLDAVFSPDKVTTAENILGCIPCLLGVYNYKNESRAVYSIYMLIATVGEIIKLCETKYVDENSNEDRKLRIKKALKELSQLRNYPIAGFSKRELDYTPNMSKSENDDPENSLETEEKDAGTLNKEESDGTEDLLVDAIFHWLDAHQLPMMVSPHLLGKISTRLYYALSNIQEKAQLQIKLGDLFHHQIVALLNAILIEDVKEHMTDISLLNINNVNFSDKTLIGNLKNLNEKATADIKNKLMLSRWLLSCPLFICYLKPDGTTLKNNMSLYCNAFLSEDSFSMSVSALLNEVATLGQTFKPSIKDQKYPTVKGNKKLVENGKERELIKLLKEHEIPKEWFENSNPRQVGRNNKLIRKHISSVFGDDSLTSQRIKQFRDFLAKNPIW